MAPIRKVSYMQWIFFYFPPGKAVLQAILDQHGGWKHPNSFFAVLHAAWASDDEFDFKRAYTCRRQALSLSNQLLETNIDDKDTIHLIRMDLLRRTELYDQLITEYLPFHFTKKTMRRVAKFQIRRARAKDKGRYQFSDTKWSVRRFLNTRRYNILLARAERLLNKNMET